MGFVDEQSKVKEKRCKEESPGSALANRGDSTMIKSLLGCLDRHPSIISCGHNMGMESLEETNPPPGAFVIFGQQECIVPCPLHGYGPHTP